jgi:glycosyltransferase involved in cell wall biosynthesis
MKHIKYDIVYVTDIATMNSGGNRFFVELASAMAKHFRVGFIAGKISPDAFNMLQASGVAVYDGNIYDNCEFPHRCPLRAFKFLIYVRKVLSNIRFCLLHTNAHIPNLFSYLYFKKTISTIHHLETMGGVAKAVQWLEVHAPRLVLHTTTKLVDRAIVLPPSLAIYARNIPRLPERGLVLMIGRLEERKNYLVALAAFGVAKQIRPELRLIIVGQGSELKRIKDLARQLGIEDSVTIIPYVSDEEKFRLYSKAEVFLHLGHPEGFSLVVLEAITMGVPTVVYKEVPVAQMIKVGHVQRVNMDIVEIAHSLIRPPPPGGQLKQSLTFIEIYRNLYELLLLRDNKRSCS